MRKRLSFALAAVLALVSMAGTGAAWAKTPGHHAKTHQVRHKHVVRSAQQPTGVNEVAGEQRESAGEQPGSELTGNDGPGGHADEPGSPNADHQFQGPE